MSNIMFIDDDLDMLSINSRYFSKEGYQVKTVSSAKEAVPILAAFSPDCIILDVMMPDQNGYETCRELRLYTNAPIIFLSGCSSENNKIKGLLIGGDDYLTKPYSFRELSARIQVQIRRTSGIVHSNTIAYPPLSINLALRKVFYKDDEISLTNREYDLLYLLVINIGKTVTFEDIGKHMWGTYSENDRKTIMVTASRLRNKFASYEALNDLVQSVRSKGYMFSHYKEL
jgi:two-component system, OmpR family, lantibiotic biosynthesis response regulator NisR/SpaR